MFLLKTNDMFIITLKVIFAFMLSAALFSFHVWIKPKQESPTFVMRSLTSVIGRQLPLLRRWGKRISSYLSWFYGMMKKSKGARKFFTLVLVMGLLLFQYVDYEASLAYIDITEELGNSYINQIGSWQGVLGLWEKNMFFLPMLTPYNLIAINMLLTFPFFSYRLSDCILSYLHRNNKMFFIIAFGVAFMMIFNVRLLIGAECIYIILAAATIYPELEQEGEDKWKKTLSDTMSFIFKRKTSMAA